MKKAYLIGASAMMLACSQGDQSMKLINTKTGFVVVEFQNGQVQFHDRFLETEMKETGILIPPSYLAQYEGKDTVFFGDPLFEKAFREIYYPLCISNALYCWDNK